MIYSIVAIALGIILIFPSNNYRKKYEITLAQTYNKYGMDIDWRYREVSRGYFFAHQFCAILSIILINAGVIGILFYNERDWGLLVKIFLLGISLIVSLFIAPSKKEVNNEEIRTIAKSLKQKEKEEDKTQRRQTSFESDIHKIMETGKTKAEAVQMVTDMMNEGHNILVSSLMKKKNISKDKAGKIASSILKGYDKQFIITTRNYAKVINSLCKMIDMYPELVHENSHNDKAFLDRLTSSLMY